MKTMFMCLLLLSAAVSSHAAGYSAEKEQASTLPIQKRIEVGMPRAEVARVLGTAHIVTKDAHGRDAWIYERAASGVSSSSDQEGVWLIRGVDAKEAARSNAITLVVTFGMGVVSDVSYHSNSIPVV
ncbi:MAG: hypothetical protein JSR46_10220 [Verrucomicrobia bacterium]|nr:hypothetical protein [Verrucomicrobiota bacterium]